MVAIIPTDATIALDTIRAHARAYEYHDTMRLRWSAITASPASLRAAGIDPTRLASQHEVSARIASTRLGSAVHDAHDADIDPDAIHDAIVESGLDGMDDVDRELPYTARDWHCYVLDKRPGSSTFGFLFLVD